MEVMINNKENDAKKSLKRVNRRTKDASKRNI